MRAWIWFQHPYAVIAVRWLLAAIFLAAAASKLRHRRRFISTVLAYRVLPKRLARVFALLLPWLEATVGLSLLVGVATRIGALLSAALFLSFLFAIGLNLWRGRTELDCGCFARRHKISRNVLLGDALLLLLSLHVALFDDGSLALHRWLSRLKRLRWDVGSGPEVILPIAFTAVGVWTIHLLIKRLVTFAKSEKPA